MHCKDLILRLHIMPLLKVVLMRETEFATQAIHEKVWTTDDSTLAMMNVSAGCPLKSIYTNSPKLLDVESFSNPILSDRIIGRRWLASWAIGVIERRIC